MHGKRANDRFLIEKVEWLRVLETNRITSNKFYNPHIKFNGKYWYISIGLEYDKQEVELSNEVLGIDVGIKNLAICSNGQKFKNINKSEKVKKQNKKLRRLQRQVSRKYLKNEKGKEYVKTSNIIKLEKNKISKP